MKNLKNTKNGLLFLAICFGLTISMNSFGQKANFSGTFNLNESKSVLGEGPMRPAFQIVVTQDENTLTTDRKSKGRDGEDRLQTSKYTLDGKVSENPAFMNNVSKSTVTWAADGKSLTIASTTVFNRDGESMEMKSSEVWSLNADGSLTILSTRQSPMGETKLTLVYDKAN